MKQVCSEWKQSAAVKPACSEDSQKRMTRMEIDQQMFMKNEVEVHKND